MNKSILPLIVVLFFSVSSCSSEKNTDEKNSLFFSELNQLLDKLDESIQNPPYKRARDIFTEEKKALFPGNRNELLKPAVAYIDWLEKDILPIQKEIVDKHHDILNINQKPINREMLKVAGEISEKYYDIYNLMADKYRLITDESVNTNSELRSKLLAINSKIEILEKDIKSLRKKAENLGIEPKE